MKTFDELYNLNVNEMTEKKNGLTYLNWASAQKLLKKNFPDARIIVHHNSYGWNYFTDGRFTWVEVGIKLTKDDEEVVETLPVLDTRNKPIPADNVNAFEVNKAIQRCKTKVIAEVTGIGLYLYEGNAEPDGEEKEIAVPAAPAGNYFTCSECGSLIADTEGKDGKLIAASDIVALARKRYGRSLCANCQRKLKAMEELRNA